jgi:hypothetical protein
MTVDGKIKQEIQEDIENLLRNNFSKEYSKEEIIHLLSSNYKDTELEEILAELEVFGSMNSTKSKVHPTCRGDNVYYKWGF